MSHFVLDDGKLVVRRRHEENTKDEARAVRDLRCMVNGEILDAYGLPVRHDRQQITVAKLQLSGHTPHQKQNG